MQTADNISTDGTLAVTGATTLSSTLAVTGAATLSSTCAITGNTTVGGTLGVTGAATFSSTVTATGDIDAGGGFRTALAFDQADATASQSAVALTVLGSDADLTAYPAYRAGSVVGISITCEAARTAGTLTVDATIDGTVTGLQAVLDGSNTTTHQASQAKGTDAFTAGQLVGVKVTTDASWAAGVTPSILVVVWIEC